MDLYFAASFNRIKEMCEYAALLEQAGWHTCTARWINGNHEIDVTTDDDLSPYGSAWQFAVEDIEDIQRSDGMVFFSSRDNEHKGRGGRHTEFGIAYTLDLPIYFIGRRECAFHALVPNHNIFKTFDEFLDRIKP